SNDTTRTLKLNYSGGEILCLHSPSSSTTGLTATLDDIGNFSLSSDGGNTGRQPAL
ncbi:hypothetical protein LINGRAHAP2_LOCUS1966, partial [Linum grandiflorum]